MEVDLVLIVVTLLYFLQESVPDGPTIGSPFAAVSHETPHLSVNSYMILCISNLEHVKLFQVTLGGVTMLHVQHLSSRQAKDIQVTLFAP